MSIQFLIFEILCIYLCRHSCRYGYLSILSLSVYVYYTYVCLYMSIYGIFSNGFCPSVILTYLSVIDGSIDIDSSRYMDTQSFKYAGNVINKNHLLNTSQLDLSHLYHMKILDPFWSSLPSIADSILWE